MLGFSIFENLLAICDSLGDIHLWKIKNESKNFELLVLKNVTHFPLVSIKTFRLSTNKLMGCAISADNHVFFWEYNTKDYQTSLLNKENLGKSDQKITCDELFATNLDMTELIQVSDTNGVLITSIAFQRNENNRFLTKTICFSFQIELKKDEKDLVPHVPYSIGIDEMLPDTQGTFTIASGLYFIANGTLFFHNYFDSKFRKILDFSKFKKSNFQEDIDCNSISLHENKEGGLDWLIISQKVGIRDINWALFVIEKNSKKIIFSEFYN